MTYPGAPLEFDPNELKILANRLDGHASRFETAHGAAGSRAGAAALGSGLAGAALPGMVAAWEAHGAWFGEVCAAHARDHREAAGAYLSTDTGSGRVIEEAGAGF